MEESEKGHKHYWVIQRPGGKAWVKSHAFAECQHCGAYTVLEYEEFSAGFKGYQPCEHVLAREGLTPQTDKGSTTPSPEKKKDPSCPVCKTFLVTDDDGDPYPCPRGCSAEPVAAG